MKRAIYYLIGVVLVVAAGSAVFWAVKDSRSHDDKTTSQSAAVTHSAPNKACQIFTLADAKTLLGDSVKGGSSIAPQSSADLNISTCTYNLGSGTDRKAASLLARVPKTPRGETSNSNEFGPFRPSTVQDVPGYGDSAYWDAEHGQLNILKNNTWYILSYGTAAPAGRSLDQTRQLADLLINKL